MKNKGILFLFLSEYRGNNTEQKYTVENSSESYTGVQTNDAPVKYLLSYAVKVNAPIHKILCIASKKVQNEINGANALQYFQQMIKKYISENTELKAYYSNEENMPQIIPIQYDEHEPNTSERTQVVYKQIVCNLEDETDVFVDYTGGFRDISFFMTTIVRYLEYNGVLCKKIVYSNFANHIIHSIDCIYEMFQLINGVEQFVQTGNAKLLSECYSNEKNERTKQLLEQIVRFSEIIMLCDIKNIDEILFTISDNLNTYQSEDDSLFGAIFQNLINIIRDKFNLKENSSMTYPELIHWCLDNNMIQQAITFYIEKMPKFYYDSGILTRMDTKRKRVKGKNNLEADMFYTDLFDYFTTKKEFGEFKEFLESLTEKQNTPILKLIENQKNSCQNEVIKRAAKRLINFLKKYYERDTQKRKNDYPLNFYSGETISPARDAQGFLNTIKTNYGLQHYFLFQNEDDFKKTKSQGTYQKKVYALNQVRQKPNEKFMNMPSEKLYNMMKYYCALKLIRNKINHASEDELTEDERIAIQQLEYEHDLCLDISFQNIKQLISEGIEAHL